MAITAGEYGWDARYFHRMLAAGAVSVLQADATRCGYTGVLQAATLCDSHQVPLSAHCAPAIHAPICAEIGTAHVRTPVTNAYLVCRLLLEKKKQTQNDKRTPPLIADSKTNTHYMS